MRIMVAATAVAAGGLVAAGVLGVASAETPTAPAGPIPAAPALRTVSVEGIATEPIDQSATAAAATTVYRQGMTDAVSDGQAKAQFLAAKAGASLAAIQSIVEGGGYIGCVTSNEYLGEQPDFGSPGVSISPSGVSARGAPRPLPAAHAPSVRRRRHPRAPVAKHASATTCTLSTQVSLVYALS